MRVYISADIEGVTGVVTWKQCGTPSSEHYDWPFARRMMTHDVNAAIRGARLGGASHIVVKDSHNVGRNLLVDELLEGVELISGTRASVDGMVDGIGAGFDALFLVGYHGMAGSTEGVMEHTIAGRVHRLWVNGIETGEIGLSAMTAGHYGIPLVLVTSDDKGCEEASKLAKGVKTAVTKFGMGRYMGRLLHPSVTGRLIESAAKEAVTEARSIAPVLGVGPFEMKIEFNRSEEADETCLLAGWSRTDAYTVLGKFGSWQEAHSQTRRALAHASLAG